MEKINDISNIQGKCFLTGKTVKNQSHLILSQDDKDVAVLSIFTDSDKEFSKRLSGLSEDNQEIVTNKLTEIIDILEDVLVVIKQGR